MLEVGKNTTMQIIESSELEKVSVTRLERCDGGISTRNFFDYGIVNMAFLLQIVCSTYVFWSEGTSDQVVQVARRFFSRYSNATDS